MYLLFFVFLSVIFIIYATSILKFHPFLALIIASVGFGIVAGVPLGELAEAINSGFGNTVGHIGIVILCGTIIGNILHKTNAATAIASWILTFTGQRNVTPSMGIIGYIVSMPVFCDSGFVLLSPVAKALAKKAGTSFAAASISLSLGLFASHVMLPPTPGPVAAAGILNADLGLVIVLGFVISAIALISGIVFAILVVSKTVLETETLKDASDMTQTPTQGSSPSNLKAQSHADKNVSTDRIPLPNQPSLAMSLAPILIPIVLIVLKSFTASGISSEPNPIFSIISFLGHPSIALLVGVGLALLLPKPLNESVLSEQGWLGEAIRSAAVIIVITGAGGAFGKVLQTTNIAELISNRFDVYSLGILLPLLLTAAVKTAQGSSTVAIITSASIMAPLLSTLGLDSDWGRALCVVAIGAGAMVVSHANDSYFWVVTQFSGMSVKQGYKLHTMGTLIQGSVAAICVYIASLIVA